jgi:hypothetical protein
MTKKHFNELAAKLKQVKPVVSPNGVCGDPAGRLQWRADCRAIADVCGLFNPAFDRERFLKACSYE